MSPSPTSPSPDLTLLREEGYVLSILSGHLVVGNVPVATADRRVARGRLVVPLTLAGDITAPPSAHHAWWSGPEPCDAFGAPLGGVAHQARRTLLAAGVEVDQLLCVVPPGREFRDHHELVTTYVALLGSPVAAIDPGATARTESHFVEEGGASPFVYADTASARAGTSGLAERLAGGSVAIVGLGGTGSYVLDLVAKTPVDRIHLFDDDVFGQHNAFRAPGAASLTDLRARRAKVDHLAAMYSRMHRGLVPHRVRLDHASAARLDGVDFAFVCVDDGPSRRAVVDLLEARGLAFVDVGMGLEATDAGLSGLLRVTTSTPGAREHVRENGRIPFAPGGGAGTYGANVQVADLNALNAALAVIRWKKLRGFHRDEAAHLHEVFVLDANVLIGADGPPEASGVGQQPLPRERPISIRAGRGRRAAKEE